MCNKSYQRVVEARSHCSTIVEAKNVRTCPAKNFLPRHRRVSHFITSSVHTRCKLHGIKVHLDYATVVVKAMVTVLSTYCIPALQRHENLSAIIFLLVYGRRQRDT